MTAKKSSVRLGAATINESKLIAELTKLKAAVIEWAEGHDLWSDAQFHTPFIHRGEAPERHIAPF
jgi:hypothetical protein